MGPWAKVAAFSLIVLLPSAPPGADAAAAAPGSCWRVGVENGRGSGLACLGSGLRLRGGGEGPDARAAAGPDREGLAEKLHVRFTPGDKSDRRGDPGEGGEEKVVWKARGKRTKVRTTTSQKCEAVPRWARV